MKEIYVYCNPTLIDLVCPLEVSKILVEKFDKFHAPTCIAKYKYDDIIDALDDHHESGVCVFWREVGSSNCFDDQVHRPRVMRKTGLHRYIEETWGATTERNVSAVIGDIARFEGKNPIEFYNSINKG